MTTPEALTPDGVEEAFDYVRCVIENCKFQSCHSDIEECYKSVGKLGTIRAHIAAQQAEVERLREAGNAMKKAAVCAAGTAHSESRVMEAARAWEALNPEQKGGV